MLSSSTKRLVAAVVLVAGLAAGCGVRWLPVTGHSVLTPVDSQATYAGVLQVAGAKGYTLVSRDDAAKRVRLRAQSNSKSFIDIQVRPGDVQLIAAGALVRDGKVHRALVGEINKLEDELKQRLGSPVAGPLADPRVNAPAVAQSAGMPQSWTEPAYDPSVWGNGNFTCLPVRVPAEHQAALTLQLSNGERADLQLSLAYAPELCRSPVQCKQPGGCPALGIGDAERVNRIAARLSRGEIGSLASLLDGGRPVATIDLSHHGSIVQALSEIKR